MIAEAAVAAAVAGTLAVVALGGLVARSGRYARFDSRRQVWRFRTPAGRFVAGIVLHDWQGRVYMVRARYRDGSHATTYCPPSEVVLHRHVQTLTDDYSRRTP